MWICSTRRLHLLLVSTIALSTIVTILVNQYNLTGSSSPKAPVNNSATRDPLLCIFTTFQPVACKSKVYRNVLFNWILLGPRVKPVLFITTNHNQPQNSSSILYNGLNYTLSDLATELGWTVITLARLSKTGMPHLKDMFSVVSRRFACTFYGYSNGDILYEQGLVHTLDAVAEILHVLARTMVIGRRTNFDFLDRDVYHADAVTRLARDEGKLFISNAQDYFFIAHNAFPWRKIPDVVIGLPAYDNFLVGTAIKYGVSVVDATESLVALHQSDKDGNFAGHNRTDKNFNRKLIGKRFRYVSGSTAASQYLTQYDDERTVAIRRRYTRTRVWASFWKRIINWWNTQV